MPLIGVTTEYENFLHDAARENDRGHINPISAEFIGEDTDSEASYMTDNEEIQNYRTVGGRRRSSSEYSDISDISLSDSDDDDDENLHTDYLCVACDRPGGRIWSLNQNSRLFVCRDCLTCEPNNINHQEVRSFVSGLSSEEIEELIYEDNMNELRGSAVLNPDFNTNYERNHQGVAYLAVESVFELISHGGYLSRDDFNHLLDIVAFVCRRPLPDTGQHTPLTDREKNLYDSARSPDINLYQQGTEPLIELLIPTNNDPWSYPSDNTQSEPIEEVHNHYLMSDYTSITATCAIYVANNFTKVRFA